MIHNEFQTITWNPVHFYRKSSDEIYTNDIKEYIRNPHKFNIKLEMDGQYYNLWSTDNDKTVPNDDVVIKSVYDPSPVGYSIPASNAFTGFTTTGNYSQTLSEYNIKGEFSKGYYFYTKKNKQGETFFFPAAGWRFYSNSVISNFNTGGIYYSAVPLNYKEGYHLNFAGHIHPLAFVYRSYGLAVRSAEEK